MTKSVPMASKGTTNAIFKYPTLKVEEVTFLIIILCFGFGRYMAIFWSSKHHFLNMLSTIKSQNVLQSVMFVAQIYEQIGVEQIIK